MIGLRFDLMSISVVLITAIGTLMFSSVVQAEIPNSKLQLAIGFNDSLNKCVKDKCINIDEIMKYFSSDCSFTDEVGQVWVGKTEIQKQLINNAKPADTTDIIEGIDVSEGMIKLRLRRSRTFKVGNYNASENKPLAQILLLKDDRIIRFISIIAPEKK